MDSLAAQQQVLWIYHQIQEWRGDYELNPLKSDKTRNNANRNDKQVAPPELLKTVKYDSKRDCAAHGKTAHADNMALFVLTFARVAGECPPNQEMTLIHKRNIT